MRNTATNKSPQQSARPRIGAKQLAHMMGRPLKQTRRLLRSKFGRHQCWEQWLFTLEEAEAIVAAYKHKRNGGKT